MSTPYPPTHPDTVKVIISYYSLVATGYPMPPEALDDLLRGIHRPHGPITEAWVNASMAEGSVPTAGIRIEGKASKLGRGGRRYVDPQAIPLILAFTLFGGHPRIKNVEPRVQLPNMDYVYLLQHGPRTHTGLGQPRGPGSHNHHTGPRKILLQRLIAGTGPGQRAELGEEHRDLTRARLRIVPDKRARQESRALAITLAMRLYMEAEDKLGLSAPAYEAMLRLALKHLDQSTTAPLNLCPSH